MTDVDKNPAAENRQEIVDRQISVKDARPMLGMIGRNYSDENIAELLDILYGIAENAYDDCFDASEYEESAE